MTNKEVERKLANALEHLAPNVFDSVVSDMETQKGTVIMMMEHKKNRSWVSRAVGIAAAFVLIFGGIAGVYAYQLNYKVVSTVSLDVNPSIEIQANQKDHVLAVNALNEDGRIVIGDMDFTGSDLDVTVNALIGSMLRNGYLSELANSILVTVDGDDITKTAQLQQQLTEEINALLQTESFSGAVLSQTLNPDSQLQTLADEYGITLGKAQLIQQLISQNTRYTFDELASLSINELNLLSESGNLHLENIESVGVASDKGYIGVDNAKQIALEHAGVDASAITRFEYEMDYENGVLVYDIEFSCDGNSYDYDIHALTGEICKHECEKNAFSYPNSVDTSASSANYIGEDAALAAAYAHAGVSASDVTLWECKLDRDDGIMLYEIEFCSGSYQYEYEINATDATVIQYSREQQGNAYQYQGGSSSAQQGTSAGGNNGSALSIDMEQAYTIAFENAGLSSGDVYDLKGELDKDHGGYVYEVEFKSGRKEYSYEIDASSGAILDYEIELDD